MAPIEIAILVALGGLVLFALYLAAFTSWYVAHSDYFSPGQKNAQYAFIWLVPIFGAALVLHILSPEVRCRRPGWVPWLEFLLVSAFVSSATTASEDAAHAEETHGDSPTPESSGND